jgi:hypothetical protein
MHVTFPNPFGGPPQLVTFLTGFSGATHASVAADSPSTNGFDLIINGNGGPNGGTPTGDTGGVEGGWVAFGPKIFTGTVVPRYIVLTVLYAPPGTNGGHSASSVSYSAGSTTGITTSASQSFKIENSVSFDASGGILGTGGGGGLSFDWSHSTTDTQSLAITKSQNSTISRTGPAADGINHDEDAIYLLLNPTVNLAVSSSSASWLLASNNSSPIQLVYVGWLNGHTQMPQNIASALASAGITSGDYADILARDPLAAGAAMDPNRFVQLNTTFPYEPPYAASDPVPVITTTITDSSTQSTTSEVADTYKVGVTISQDVGFADFAKSSLKDSASWEWTDKSTQSSLTGSVQSASVSIGGPAYGYTGPTVLEIFEDQVYHTFAFNLELLSKEEVSLAGTVKTSHRKPVRNEEVILSSKQGVYRTFTNSKGKYRFIGHITGPITVRAREHSRLVNQSQTARQLNIKLP